MVTPHTAEAESSTTTPELCSDCYGAGQLFTNYASDYCNPSVKPEWLTCDRCGGDGYEPQSQEEE